VGKAVGLAVKVGANVFVGTGVLEGTLVAVKGKIVCVKGRAVSVSGSVGYGVEKLGVTVIVLVGVRVGALGTHKVSPLKIKFRSSLQFATFSEESDMP
jgi:hypothetical protein